MAVAVVVFSSMMIPGRLPWFVGRCPAAAGLQNEATPLAANGNSPGDAHELSVLGVLSRSDLREML
jgi:hypothetical protein